MKALIQGAAALIVAALAGTGLPIASAHAQDAGPLAGERQKVSYMIGQDVGRSIKPIGADLDMDAFAKAIENAFEGGEPLVSQEEAPMIGQALMMRSAARAGQAPEGASVPELDARKAGYLVGNDIGNRLKPIKDEVDLPVLIQSVQTQVSGGTSLLSETELAAVRDAFSQRMQADAQRRADAAKGEGEAFLAKNKDEAGVISTASGLQYRVVRQGSGPRPRPTDTVRVNYHGTLLDGTVFDSSYDRGQPAEFALNQVIAGWTEGVALMPVGSKYTFWIPSDLAYGSKGAPPMVPPNSVLKFDVELQAIQ